ncbi:hypothetical protein CIP107536_00619 [Corynebacterium diphtheriae]|nr:hypothetical protein CIP107536_00619 [Corynebacterium diphtheriae]
MGSEANGGGYDGGGDCGGREIDAEVVHGRDDERCISNGFCDVDDGSDDGFASFGCFGVFVDGVAHVVDDAAADTGNQKTYDHEDGQRESMRDDPVFREFHDVGVRHAPKGSPVAGVAGKRSEGAPVSVLTGAPSPSSAVLIDA